MTIGRHRSPGLSGQFLPGCDVEIGPPQIAELITERPSSKNGFGRLVIQNKSEEAIPRLQVHWTIKKTIN